MAKCGANFKRLFINGEMADVSSLSFEEEIIAVITGQFIAKRAHLQKYLNINKVERI